MSDRPQKNLSEQKRAPFYVALKRCLRRRGLRLEQICQLDDAVSRRVLEEYGAMFVAADCVRVPPACVFKSAAEVEAFQREATFLAAAFGSDELELQPAAMTALLRARDEARGAGLDVTPRGGAEAARRSYDDTLRLWDSRFLPALDYWGAQENRLSPELVESLRSLSPAEQVPAVLQLEAGGIFFSKDFSKSVLRSVAAPGTSQHLTMLAVDVAEFKETAVREILAHHGWFQTVLGDLPHFTFLGLGEHELPARGLRQSVEAGGDQTFWTPDVG